MVRKRLRKIIRQLLVTFCILKKNEYVQFTSQTLILTVENKQLY